MTACLSDKKLRMKASFESFVKFGRISLPLGLSDSKTFNVGIDEHL